MPDQPQVACAKYMSCHSSSWHAYKCPLDPHARALAQTSNMGRAGCHSEVLFDAVMQLNAELCTWHLT